MSFFCIVAQRAVHCECEVELIFVLAAMKGRICDFEVGKDKASGFMISR